ncbi:hypothetical protein ICA16_20955 [Pseudomonas anatoliensis]|uniref:hypothetical protein n=1 Tax=Pseudomonas anatoliensis TaxID=2710589 RepID=UPI001B327BB6|nr:hypothetical protein [Pseudomonas anatoliensis]MBP5958151.1 hypothetical protein [Pseudomonas anatoliensis]
MHVQYNNKSAVDMPTVPSARLGLVYLFRTNYVDVYKLGFTETSISGRHKKLMDRMGISRIEAVVMTVDAREQEAAAFAMALQHADRPRTFATRKRFNATELFVLDESAVLAVREYLLAQVALQPYLAEVATSFERQRAVEKAIEYNKSASQVEMTLQGMDRVLRKLNKSPGLPAP